MSKEEQKNPLTKKKITRRKALSTAAKVGIAAGVGVVVGAIGGYLGGSAAVPPPKTTTVFKTVTKTVTSTTGAATVTKTVTETATSTATATVTATTTATASPTAWKPKLEGVSLTVLSSPDCADYLKYAAQEFMKLYPQVSIEVVPLSWEALYPKILSDLESKTGAYDLFTIDVMTLGSVVKAGAASFNKIMKENPDIIDPNLDLNDFEPTYFGYGSIWAGEIYGFPVYPNHMFLYYRKDYFEDPKIKDQFKAKTGKPLKVPETWQEAIEVAKFFTRSHNPDSPTEYGIALMFPTTHTMMYNVLNWLGPFRQSPTGISKYGELDLYYGDYCTKDGKVWFANEDGEKVVKLIQDILPYSPDPFGSDYGETIAQFSAGTTAMCPQWSVPYGDFVKALAGGDKMKARDIIGVEMIPGIVDQGKLVRKPVSGGWAMGINGAISRDEKRAAFVFAEFATSKKMDLIHWTKFVMPPARMSNWQKSEAREVLSPALFDTYAKSMRSLSYRPRIPQEPEMERIGNPMWQDIIAGRKPLMDGLKQLASEWQKLVDQFKHP
ncbi:MAG: extracellular solute-binding protein [Thaumarchaeota archaeon]|nr:extracellular solute-binding protein [Nitrososphaerota archaeon]